jgi:biopolymer transport protein ExbD
MHSRESDMDSTMTPMIDVVFLLLVFFVWTSSFQAVEALLPSRLAAESGGQAAPPIEISPEFDFDQVVVRVDWQEGRVGWQINDAPLDSLEHLRSALDQIHTVQPQAPIIVHPFEQVPLAHVIQAYDLARLSGFTKVSLAADLSGTRD